MFADFSTKPGGKGEPLPRVALLRLEPVSSGRPGAGNAAKLIVSIREEGTPLAWATQVTVSVAAQQRILSAAERLQAWARGSSMTAPVAARTAERLGHDLYRAFLGPKGVRTLEALAPTAVLMQVDETLVNLPWELMWREAGPLALVVPFGRVVTTGGTPHSRRDPVAEDPTLRILAVANPTEDLAASEAEIAAIRALPDTVTDASVEVTVLERDAATVDALRHTVQGEDFDILHFAGHASFDSGDPRASALHLADGLLRADEVAQLPWAVPPYVVFNSACESARAGAAQRLFTPRGRVNGLAAAFLAAGVEAYLGHYWPVGDAAARRFAECFYSTLFARRSIGLAVYASRQQAAGDFFADQDLTAVGAVYFGDHGGASGASTAAKAS